MFIKYTFCVILQLKLFKKGFYMMTNGPVYIRCTDAILNFLYVKFAKEDE